MDLTLDQQIDKAHSESQEIESAAAELEKRIMATGCKLILRKFGSPVIAAEYERNMTARSLIQRRDPALASYLGFPVDNREADAAAAAKAASVAALEQATAQARVQNEAAAARRYQNQLNGISSTTGRRLGL